MRFREYNDSTATLKEWARQLNIANRGIYPLYATVDNTLNHWKDELNKNIGANTFSILSTPESTLNNWKDKLNQIYNN